MDIELSSERIEELMKFCNLNNLPFNDITLLNTAFIHKTFACEYWQKYRSYLEENERLEFLGDAVLEQSVRMYLYDKRRDYDQGKLTFHKEPYVTKHAVYVYGDIMNLKDYLLVGNGINLDYERVGKKIIGDAFEALLGAIALDLGFDKAHEFFLNQVIACTNKMIL
jgi:ribonuclease-3